MLSILPVIKICLPFFSFILAPAIALAQYGGVDDFEDNAVDPLKWTVIAPTGSGSLVESGGNLHFNSTGSGTELQYYAWADAKYDEDFEIVFRAGNTTFPESSEEFAGIGVEIYPTGSTTTRLNVRLGSYYVATFGPSRDVLANFFVSSILIPNLAVQPATIFPKAAAMRLLYDATDKVFTVFYDANPTDGVQWTQLSTFGVSADANGANNTDFGMSAGSQFDVYVYARTDNLDADSGELLLDDFQLIEGTATDPPAEVESSAAIVFTTELGKSYSVFKSYDLSATPAFTAVGLVGSGDTYEAVPLAEGEGAVTGTGNDIRVLDSTSPSHDSVFYKIFTQ